MFEFKAIKELFENLRARFEVLKASWIIKLENNLIYSFLKKRREWITASLRNYSLFLLWGSTSLALVRFFQMWVTDSWHLINFYYSSVAFSFFFTFLLISLRYLRDRGYFKKGEENREKWKAYQNFVAEKHNLKWNFRFSRSLFFLLTLDFIFLNFYRDYHIGQSLSNFGMFVSSFIFFCYMINHFYIVYWMKKTPTPNQLLPDPPNIYVKIASIPTIDRILSRRYSTRTRAERLRLFYATNKKEIWATSLGVATLIYWATGTDRSIADYNAETTYGSRVYTTSKGGWYTTIPKIKTRAHQLIEWGVDPKELCYENTKLLNAEEVNSTYERIKDEKYPKPYRAEIRELKIHLSTAESDLENAKSDLENAKSDLRYLATKNLELEKRLIALEKAKELETK